MCSIAGIISPQKNSLMDIKKMCAVLRHRGPDDRGIFADEAAGVYLGHNRLSIIDLSSRGRQPITNEEKNIFALVNGEIYNFEELREDLRKQGHVFSSDTDAEVIVHAYEAWGENFVHRFKGMFAIALWDKRREKLILARDSVGIKPLYYLEKKDMFAFASEAKAFLSLNEDVYTPQINPKAVERLLHFSFVPDNDVTILQGVKKLPPGHILTWTKEEIVLRKYWELRENPSLSNVSFEDACRLFEVKMISTLTRHLKSDVKIGFLLSGGVDSGYLTALGAKLTKEPLLTFTAGFRHPFDECVSAKKIAGHLHCEHINFYFDVKSVGERIEDMAWSFDDFSCIDAGLVTAYLMSEKLKAAGIKVIITGEGADEIFGGYPWFALASFPWKFFPQNVRDALYYYRIAKTLPGKTSCEGIRVMNRLMGDFKGRDFFRRISGFEICRQLPNSFLMKLDKGPMAFGVETRVPYLDTDIVEFIYNLPSGYKRAWAADKRLLRQAACRYLPRETAYRPKRGFVFPVDSFLKENRERVWDRLFRQNSIARAVLTKSEFAILTKAERIPVLSKIRNTLLWKLFILEIWQERFRAETRRNHAPGRVSETSHTSCIYV